MATIPKEFRNRIDDAPHFCGEEAYDKLRLVTDALGPDGRTGVYRLILDVHASWGGGPGPHEFPEIRAGMQRIKAYLGLLIAEVELTSRLAINATYECPHPSFRLDL